MTAFWKLFDYQNNVVKTMMNLNEFWSKLIFTTILTYTPISSTLLSFVCFKTFNTSTTVVLSIYVVQFAGIFFLPAIIPQAMVYSEYMAMQKVVASLNASKIKMPMNMKLKLTLLQERFREQKIGFSCAKLFYISPKVAFEVKQNT